MLDWSVTHITAKVEDTVIVEKKKWNIFKWDLWAAAYTFKHWWRLYLNVKLHLLSWWTKEKKDPGNYKEALLATSAVGT